MVWESRIGRAGFSFSFQGTWEGLAGTKKEGTHTTWSLKCHFDSIGKMLTSCYSQNVNDDTEGPDVTREVVLLGCQHFWS